MLFVGGGGGHQHARVKKAKTKMASRAVNIKFLCAARADDAVLVASLCDCSNADADEFTNSIKDVLRAKHFGAAQRLRLLAQSNAFNIASDGEGRVFVAITTSEYPERVAFNFLKEVREGFSAASGNRFNDAEEGALSKNFEPLMRRLVNE